MPGMHGADYKPKTHPTTFRVLQGSVHYCGTRDQGDGEFDKGGNSENQILVLVWRS